MVMALMVTVRMVENSADGGSLDGDVSEAKTLWGHLCDILG